MGIAVAGRQLNQAQPVAMRVEPHRLGVDSDRRNEGEALGKLAMMQLMAHAACAGLSHNREGRREASLPPHPMAGYGTDRYADATATARSPRPGAGVPGRRPRRP